VYTATGILSNILTIRPGLYPVRRDIIRCENALIKEKYAVHIPIEIFISPERIAESGNPMKMIGTLIQKASLFVKLVQEINRCLYPYKKKCKILTEEK